MTAAELDIGDDELVSRRETVYFILNTHNRLVKIGYTTDVARRLIDLQTASGYRLQLILRFIASRAVERAIHEFLSSERMVGEWFRMSEKTEKLVDELGDFLSSEDDDLEPWQHEVTVEDLQRIVSDPSYGAIA